MLPQPRLPDELGQAARPQARLLRDLDRVGLRAEQLVPHRHRDRQDLERLAQHVLDRAVTVEEAERVAHLVGAVAELGEGGAHLAARRRRRVGAGEIEVGDVEPALELDEHPRRGARTDTGDERERRLVVFEHRAPQRVRRVDREHREGELGPDARRTDERLEGVALVAGREGVERERVLAHVEVREHEHRRGRARTR